MTQCDIRGLSERTRLLLEVVSETGEDLHLTPCDRSQLMLMGLYTRRQLPDDGGLWIAELTPLGEEFLK